MYNRAILVLIVSAYHSKCEKISIGILTDNLVFVGIILVQKCIVVKYK